MAELLRDNQIAVLLVALLLVALFALRMRRRGGAGPGRDSRMDGRARPPRYSHRAEAPPEEGPRGDPERERRRMRLQMILALIAVVGFTLIALVNTFRGVSDVSP